uniref:Unc-45 myosin chaperone A n=1 Tax=Otus sunia TaxID=257818 RepID=A0A8C8BH64_9STRI
MGRDGGGSRRGCGFCLRQSQSCLCPGSAGKMLGGLLLRLLLAMALCPGLLGTVSVQNLHLCEGYVGPGGRYHPGFYCPRLSDPASHRYCCRPSPRALKSCCSQPALEALTGVNLSSLAGPGLLRNPLALPFVGLYGLLVLLLMAVDLFHFYRTRRCHLGRLLPRTCRLPRRPPGGRQTHSRTPRSPGGLLPPLPPRGRAG